MWSHLHSRHLVSFPASLPTHSPLLVAAPHVPLVWELVNLAFLVMAFPSFPLRSLANSCFFNGVHHGFRGDGKPTSLANLFAGLWLQGIFSCCLYSPVKVSCAHTFLAPFKLLLRQSLMYLKVPKLYNVNILCFIIHESWDIIWNNTKLVKHGSSVIQ